MLYIYEMIELTNYKKIMFGILLILALIDTVLTLYIIKAGLGYEVNIIPSFFLNNPNLPTIIIYPSFLVIKYLTILTFYYYSEKFKEEINKFIVYFFFNLLIIFHILAVCQSLSIIFFSKVIINV